MEQNHIVVNVANAPFITKISPLSTHTKFTTYVLISHLSAIHKYKYLIQSLFHPFYALVDLLRDETKKKNTKAVE